MYLRGIVDPVSRRSQLYRQDNGNVSATKPVPPVFATIERLRCLVELNFLEALSLRFNPHGVSREAGQIR
jgi:hypothetical protein